MTIFSNFSCRLTYIFVLLTIPFSVHSSDQQVQIPTEIVFFYAKHCSLDYPEKFVETACLKVVREHGLPYLHKQYSADLPKKNLSKSDVFKQISGFCTTLANVYMHNPFFKQRYNKQQYSDGFKEHFSDTSITADMVLNAYQKDRNAITMDYDQKRFVAFFDDGMPSLAGGLYLLCERERLRSDYEDVHNISVPEAPYLTSNLNDPVLSSFLAETKEQVGDSFSPNLYSMGIEVVKQQTGLPTSKWGQVETQKVCDFYNSMDSMISEICVHDARYAQCATELLSRCISKRIFANTALDLSCRAVATRHIFQCVLKNDYEQWLLKKFDTTVCAPFGHEYARRAQSLLNCFSQDAQATLLLCQRDREMAQLQTAKQKEFLGVMRGLLLDTAYNLKQTACTQEEQGMLAQRAKLQADSQEWIAAAEQLEKSRAGFELGVQSGIDMLQLAKQGVRDVGAVGVEYLAQKNNGSVQKSRMQTWIEFVAGKKQQRAAADTLAQKNALVVLNPYLTRFMQVIPHRKELRQKFEIDSAAWKAAQQKLETERTVYEQRLNDGAALVEQTNSAACECAAEKLHSVADLLAQSNRGLQQQQEQNLLRAMLVGCYQVIKKNSQSKVSYETMSNNSSTEEALQLTVSMRYGSSVDGVDQLEVVPVQGTVVAQRLRGRTHNPYAAKVLPDMQSQLMLPGYTQRADLPPDYYRGQGLVCRSNGGNNNRRGGYFPREDAPYPTAQSSQPVPTKYVTPAGTHIYRQQS